MTNLEFNLSIKASPKKLWQVLWNDTTYRKWTSAFHEGSYAVSEWKEGSKIQFLSPGGNGMFSLITECKPNELMAFKHLGEIKNYEEQPSDIKSESWKDAKEIYSLKENNDHTTLHVFLNATGEFSDYLKKTFPVALKTVKDLAENPIIITVETTVVGPIEKIWDYWSKPEHVLQWNNASDDWHTPSATNDLRKGGSFDYLMAAKDGSFAFDFSVVYDEVKKYELIIYTIGDVPPNGSSGWGRKVKIDFINQGSTCKIVESFEAEEVHSLELQQIGWQNILNNFKRYTEGK